MKTKDQLEIYEFLKNHKSCKYNDDLRLNIMLAVIMECDEKPTQQVLNKIINREMVYYNRFIRGHTSNKIKLERRDYEH